MQNRAVRAQDAVEKVQKWLHALPRRWSGKIGGVQVDIFWTALSAQRDSLQGCPLAPLVASSIDGVIYRRGGASGVPKAPERVPGPLL